MEVQKYWSSLEAAEARMRRREDHSSWVLLTASWPAVSFVSFEVLVTLSGSRLVASWAVSFVSFEG